MKMLKYNIDKKLLPIKAHYFLWNSGTGPVVSFLSIYARNLGFSSVIVGLIYTILPICGMLTKPIVGAIADRYKCQKLAFLIAQILTAIAFLAINYSPQVPVERKVHFACDYSETVFDTSINNATVNECVIKELQVQQKIINCKLNCAVDDKYWNVICSNWSLPEYCQQSHSNRLQFMAHVPKSRIQLFVETVVFSVKNVTMSDGSTHHPLCSCGEQCHLSTECDIECDDSDVNEIVTKSIINDDNIYTLYEFWIFLGLMICGWIGQAVVVSVGDAICFEMLGDKPNRYGYQRMFGALGWGIFTSVAGFMVDKFSEGQATKDYTSAFYLGFSFLLLDFIVSYQIQYTQKKHSHNILRDVGRLLVDLNIIVFLIWCIFVGLCTGLIWQFLLWLVEDLAEKQSCGSNSWLKTLEGLVMAVQCLLGELPFFFLSSSILKRIGHIYSMTLVLMVFGVRFILYSVITNPWWFLPVELLNGLTFGLFYACMASYTSIAAPTGTEATMQGMVGAVFEGVGVSLGSFIGGLLYHEYGGPITFRVFGIGALIACLLHASIQYLIKRKRSQTEDFSANYTSPRNDLVDTFEDDLDQEELTLVGS